MLLGMNNIMGVLVFLIVIYQCSYYHDLDLTSSSIVHRSCVYAIQVIHVLRLNMSSSYVLASSSYDLCSSSCVLVSSSCVLHMFMSSLCVHPSYERRR